MSLLYVWSAKQLIVRSIIIITWNKMINTMFNVNINCLVRQSHAKHNSLLQQIVHVILALQVPTIEHSIPKSWTHISKCGFIAVSRSPQRASCACANEIFAILVALHEASPRDGVCVVTSIAAAAEVTCNQYHGELYYCCCCYYY